MFEKKLWLEFYGSKKPNQSAYDLHGRVYGLHSELKDEHLFLAFYISFVSLENSGVDLVMIAKAVAAVEWKGQRPGIIRYEAEKSIADYKYLVVLKMKLQEQWP